MDDENEGNNADRNAPLEEDVSFISILITYQLYKAVKKLLAYKTHSKQLITLLI